jgi:hypothetical protein
MRGQNRDQETGHRELEQRKKIQMQIAEYRQEKYLKEAEKA